MGPINDYGQTLEAGDRTQLGEYIARLAEEGIRFVYLATWRDPFFDPQRYAAEVFRAWALSDKHVLFVLIRGEDRRWHVALLCGSGVSLPKKTQELLARAQLEANRTRPGYAALQFVGRFLSAVKEEKAPGKNTPSFPWRYVLFGGLFLAALFWFSRRICPRCGRPLRRTESISGILWVCPRCRYTRAGRGRRLGSRRGFSP